MKNTWKTLLGARSCRLSCLGCSRAGWPAEDLVLDDMSAFSRRTAARNIARRADGGGGCRRQGAGPPHRNLQADHQNKPDVGSAQAQRYIQEQGIVQ
jgi:hypothetical protein